jgi:MFS family permease
VTETGEFTPRAVGVALSALVGSALNGMVLASVAISILIGQIATDHSWNAAEIGGAASFLFAGMAIGSLTLGRLIDARGARAVQLPLTLCSGLLLGSMSFTGASLPLFYGAHLLLGIANPGAITYNRLLSTWFFRNRGVALTMVGIGVFVAQALSPPAIRYLQTFVGWHETYRLLALGELCIAFPTLLLLFHERRGGASPTTASEIAEVRPDGAPLITVPQAMMSGSYWLLIGCQAAGLFAFMGVSAHAVGILTNRGVPSSTAVWGLSMFALGGLLAQPLTGVLLDRTNTPRIIVPFAIASAMSLLLLAAMTTTTASLLSLLLFGVCCGGQTSVTSYMATRYFGVRNYSRIYGTLFPILLLLSAPAPAVIGMMLSYHRGYGIALVVMAISQAIPALFSYRLGSYPYPVKSDQRQ